MTRKEELVNNLLQLEVAKKGQAATYAFFGFALISFFYGYGCVKFLPYIQAVAAVLFVLSIVRYYLYKNIIENNSITPKQWAVTVTLVTLNGIGYGLILWLASVELKMSGVHFVVATTLIAGLVGSSIVTLSYFSFLFIPFQAFLLIPQMGTILYLYNTHADLNYLPLVMMYVMYFAYQIAQFRAYRRDLIQLFKYQIELEAKNAELKESKELIVAQTSQLVHASRLAVVGEMSAGVAHEINNPLTIISSSSQMLSRFSKSQELDNMLLNRYLEKINKSIDRISSIVKGLKYFANQADRSPKKSCNIQDIMNETTPFCLDHLNSLNIKFRVNNIPDVMINCHSVQISQVLINLLKNASDALDLNLPVEDRWINIDFKAEDEYFYFIVSNGGDKISREIASRIFNPFFTTKDTGTGLGLSISQTIMKDHGGELYLDVNNYANTTFVIKHPIETFLH